MRKPGATRSGQAKRQKKKKAKDINRDGFASQIINEEQARLYLFENKISWEQLASVIGTKCQIYQWKYYFRYSMLTIVTQSNLA